MKKLFAIAVLMLAVVACSAPEPVIVEVTRVVVVTATPQPATITPEPTITPRPTKLPTPNWDEIEGTASWSYDGYWGRHVFEVTVINSSPGDMINLKAMVTCTGQENYPVESGRMPVLPYVIPYGDTGTVTINDIEAQRYVCATFTVRFFSGESVVMDWYFDFR